MARLEWTNQALADVVGICEFIAKDAPSYAHLFARDVFQAAERLQSFPKAGRVVPEYGKPSIREIILGNYRIIYRLTGSRAQVLTVYHGARLLPEQMK
jgi:toxin ParE1/3/4